MALKYASAAVPHHTATPAHLLALLRPYYGLAAPASHGESAGVLFNPTRLRTASPVSLLMYYNGRHAAARRS